MPTPQELTLIPMSRMVQARGRNDWFRPKALEILGEEGRISLSMRSQRTGDAAQPPWAVTMNYEDLLVITKALVRFVQYQQYLGGKPPIDFAEDWSQVFANLVLAAAKEAVEKEAPDGD